MGREIGMTVYHLVFFRFKSSVLTCFGSPQSSSFFRVQGRRDGGTEGRGAHVPHILADQLTLSQPGGADYAPSISARPLRFSDLAPSLGPSLLESLNLM